MPLVNSHYQCLQDYHSHLGLMEVMISVNMFFFTLNLFGYETEMSEKEKESVLINQICFVFETQFPCGL